MSPLVSKLSKTFRWLRWSTICAILFYMFFIGLILHSTTYKLQHTLKSRTGSGGVDNSAQQAGALKQQMLGYSNKYLVEAKEAILTKEALQRSRQKSVAEKVAVSAALQEQSSAANGNNVLNTPPEAVLATTFQQQNVLQRTNGAGVELSQRAGSEKSTAARVAAAVAGGGMSAGSARQGGKSSEPETVILAASSVNEKQILEKAFKRADRDGNSELTIQELGVYINQKILDHIEEAIQNNPREFQHVDKSPADGLITWEEYHTFFLKEHGMTDADIDEHNEIKHTALNRKAREDMMRDKARWSEAARTDLFSLTIDEYLSFRHPESSISNLLELVDDLLRQFDQDGDDTLTIDEFSEVNVDDDDDLRRKSLISQTVVERRAEFKRIIDKNNDGKADREELLNYVNPKTPRYALQEAATLFSLCDENKDGRLTLNELTENAEIFLTSKMIDTANSFHTEF
ncbi:45 kDa calcium-binding protein [Zeugodacus cucurbitae]|uniref:45 kDa calcium-binding protein n=1 Tax=Zeugodacus cucurbitae TaxID=28588 RepID=UPI0005968E0B|nr:45 kDa calcium-binding protein [Zeugodacus cucurbitae]XP_028897135.1 45 kDa calcium-binding protein [Zeugodacus cucurbitae]XP_028897136.1 45 kDa calcium-binding protein [Zeugodacus cucurbitae]XP_028897137.1 45 kDa calcium-binding protein [Zeugodacus cucurbitae]XP_054087541.1 45 kDa calcium-binding protein [Zeugodacus cucurbitae]XP_054087542.1 45 kDa calcium-binding protein [Zeugodacus cucurbitae]XP_054087544.1 45 kDa calcium-binding protein [Zeugodacus cucurbitae]XP_054087546.1 45 kDa cal